MSSIARGVLHAIDDEHVHRCALTFELEPELLLHRGHQRWTVGINRGECRCPRRWSRQSAWPTPSHVRRPVEIDVVDTGETGAIHHDASGLLREEWEQCGDAHAGPFLH